MSEQKYQGTVKWFSNRKGYGFITPDDGCPITEDIFVHQSVLHSEGYRTLSESWIVEFSVGHDDDGKAKAENVTAPGGGYVTGPRRPPRRTPKKDAHDDGGDEAAEGKEGEEKASGGGRKGGRHRGPRQRGERAPPPPHWHNVLKDDVKNTLEDKGMRTSTGTIDVSRGTARIKLGTRGYSSMADSRAILAEGSFECDADGNVTFGWKRAMKFDGGDWKKIDEKGDELPHAFNLGEG
uniref:CSD domain-containing protein n=1 Tax=Odontella aurita TaxID=265563 RepID=A0A7S4IG27_9STRA